MSHSAAGAAGTGDPIPHQGARIFQMGFLQVHQTCRKVGESDRYYSFWKKHMPILPKMMSGRQLRRCAGLQRRAENMAWE